MGHSSGSIAYLTHLVGLIPANGAILELGDQCINGDLGTQELSALRRLIETVSKDQTKVDEIILHHFMNGDRRLARAFDNSDITYRSLDIHDDDGVIQADLNHYRVPSQWRGRFDIVTNFGTTEHVLDQINAFRVMHDFAKLGGLFVHRVPFSGYYNHGLFAYNPVFFIFLSHANGYEIETLGLSQPHLPYHIPTLPSIEGSEHWRGILQQSGMLSVMLRKKINKEFELFSDFDANIVGVSAINEPWRSIIADRYDLRVRS